MNIKPRLWGGIFVDNKLSPLDYDPDHFDGLFKIVGGSERGLAVWRFLGGF